MCKMGKKKLDGFLDTSVNTYIRDSHMSNYGQWGTEVEILSAANLMGQDIMVYSHWGNLGLHWQRIPSKDGFKENPTGCIYLDNHTRDHYQVVASVQLK